RSGARQALRRRRAVRGPVRVREEDDGPGHGPGRRADRLDDQLVLVRVEASRRRRLQRRERLPLSDGVVPAVDVPLAGPVRGAAAPGGRPRAAAAGRALGHPVVRVAGRRLLLAIPLLLVVSASSFVLLSLTPGDAANQILGPHATPEQYAALRRAL